LFWTATVLENKLRDYLRYYNKNRAHYGRARETPVESDGGKVVDINYYRLQKYCRGLFQLPMAA
jgi:putative transposase